MSTYSKNEKKVFVRKFYKDNFAFIIEAEDESIFEDIQRFISFENKPDNNIEYDITRISFRDKKDLDEIIKRISEQGREIVIHGGTPEQHVYGKKTETDGNIIYRIPLNDEYILQDMDKKAYFLYGGQKGKEDNLYRIVREIYYRKSLALGRVALHSAAVADKRGRCILIPGKKAAGKTTLLCNFLASDKYDFIDNDRLLLEVDDNGQLLAHSMSSTVNVGYGTMRICPERFKGIKISGYYKPTEKKRYTRSEFINQIGCLSATTGKVKSILFPSIKKGAKTNITPCSDAIKMSRISLAIEEFNNSEHPDWLGISNVSEEQYKQNIAKILDSISEMIPANVVEFGYERIEPEKMKEIDRGER